MTDNIETRRLFCRKPRPSDSDFLHPVFSNPDTMRYFGPERPLSQDETSQWIENHERLRPKEGLAPWIICLKATAQVIGWGGLTRNSEDESPLNELIYILDLGHWGKGLGTELAQNIIEYGFHTLSLHDIEASVRPTNLRSVRILKRIRMTCVRRDETGRDRYQLKRLEYQSFAEQGGAPDTFGADDL